MKKILLLLLIPIVFEAVGQKRVESGRIYDQGEVIFGPMVGYKGKVPSGWYGTLPKGEEVFLLLPADNQEAYMFINVHEKSLEQLNSEWNTEFALTDAITISLQNEAEIKSKKLSAEFTVSGTTKEARAYAEAIDGGHGYVFSFILLAPTSNFDTLMKSLRQLIDTSIFEEASIASLYDDFNWPEFVADKYFTSYISSRDIVEKSHIWICADGTFKTKIKSGGLIKVKGDKNTYKGTLSGTWTADGIGPKGKLHLNFKKKPPLTVDLEINDEKIYLNGFRYFGLYYSDCK